jgi:signal transduction histidine kinase
MSADFLSIASHELRSPLTCIKGYVGALRATLPDEQLANPEVARYLERIDHETDLMAAKVSELLTFGMIEAGQLQLEPREIMTEGFLLMVGEAFRPIAAERNIGFRMDVAASP